MTSSGEAWEEDARYFLLGTLLGEVGGARPSLACRLNSGGKKCGLIINTPNVGEFTQMPEFFTSFENFKWAPQTIPQCVGAPW